MDSRSQNDSDGGGGQHGWSPGTPRDERRQQTHDSPPPDHGLNNGAAVLSLDQIRITGISNEYTEGPVVGQRSPAPQQRKNDASVTSPASRTNAQQQETTRDERPNNLRNLRSLSEDGNINASRDAVLRSSSADDSQSSVRTSVGSVSSGSRLLGGGSSLGSDSIIVVRAQPKRSAPSSEELKPLSDESRAVATVPGSGGGGSCCKMPGKHRNKCEMCGRCQCPECCQPRALPSCWTCGRRCVCSVQSAVEYGTCVCCVKGLFYHCSSDDEDTCADKPFSCSQSHCCVRWTTVSLLSVVFPCLLCYLPAKGCVAACQSCYDRVTRPGCRCKNAKPLYRHVSKQT